MEGFFTEPLQHGLSRQINGSQSMNLSPARRRAAIFDLIVRRGEVSVDVLATRFATSSETIRRDLNRLAENGHIRKVHGGARRLPGSTEEEGAFDERMVRNTHAKRVLAEKARALVHPGQTVFMDTGSTTLLSAQALASTRQLTIITNSVAIADTFASQSSSSSVYLLGGEYRNDNRQTVGPATVQDAMQFQADSAILTVGGIDANGAWDYSHDEARVARAMMSASRSLTVLADHTKFGCKAAFKVCTLAQIDDLVTDTKPVGTLASALKGARVTIH